LKNILYLADFSSASKAALALAVKVARTMDAKFHVLHLSSGAVSRAGPGSIPLTKWVQENSIEDSASIEVGDFPYQILTGLDDEWVSVERAIQDLQIDLLVVGIRARARDEKPSLGPVVDEIFDRSPIPVLTVGNGKLGEAPDRSWFQRGLVVADFTPESKAAVSFAASLANQNQALLTVLHVRQRPARLKHRRQFDLSAAESYHRLYESIPAIMQLEIPCDFLLAYGHPTELILQSAEERAADLIILGICAHSEHVEKSQKLARITVRQVAAFAKCPVLTLRGT